MTAIEAGIPVTKNLMPIDTSKLKVVHVSEASKEVFDRFMESHKAYLEYKHTTMPDTSNSPRNQPYADVVVNGETVATVYNNGGVQSSNAMGGKILKILSGNDTSLSGPLGAQERAEKIAAALGGEVEKSATAISQSHFNSIEEPMPTIDYESLRADPEYQKLLQLEQARTVFLAQQIGQSEDLLDAK